MFKSGILYTYNSFYTINVNIKQKCSCSNPGVHIYNSSYTLNVNIKQMCSCSNLVFCIYNLPYASIRQVCLFLNLIVYNHKLFQLHKNTSVSVRSSSMVYVHSSVCSPVSFFMCILLVLYYSQSIVYTNTSLVLILVVFYYS